MSDAFLHNFQYDLWNGPFVGRSIKFLVEESEEFDAAFFGRLDSLFNTIHVNDNNFTLQRVETIAEAQLLPGEEVIQIDRIPEGDNPYCEGCGRLVLENEPGYEAVANHVPNSANNYTLGHETGHALILTHDFQNIYRDTAYKVNKEYLSDDMIQEGSFDKVNVYVRQADANFNYEGQPIRNVLWQLHEYSSLMSCGSHGGAKKLQYRSIETNKKKFIKTPLGWTPYDSNRLHYTYYGVHL